MLLILAAAFSSVLVSILLKNLKRKGGRVKLEVRHKPPN